MKIGSQWTSKRIVGISAVEWFKPGCLGLIPDDCLLFHFSLSHILVTRLSSLCKLKAMGSWPGKLARGWEGGYVVVQICLQYPWLHLNYEHPYLTCAVEGEGKGQGKV